MITVDFSQAVIASCFVFKDDLRKADISECVNIIRHAFLTTLKGYKQKFMGEYGSELVLLADGDSYWRKDIFPEYKFSRKKQREDSDMPWDKVNECKKILLEEMKKYSPYRILIHPKAEADDLFAILVRYVAAKRVDETALFDAESERVIMCASDGDLKQLHSKTVRQHSPMTKTFVTLDGVKPEAFLREKILTGDSGDGIPNVFSSKTCFVEKVRQTPCTQKKMAPILESAVLEDGTHDEFVRDRITLNRTLVDFNEIPEYIITEVLELYSKPHRGNKESLFRYLSKNRCSMLLDEIDKF